MIWFCLGAVIGFAFAAILRVGKEADSEQVVYCNDGVRSNREEVE